MIELFVAILVVILLALVFMMSGSEAEPTMDHPDIIVVLMPLRQQADAANAVAAEAVAGADDEHMTTTKEHANNAVVNAQAANIVLNAAENAAANALNTGKNAKEAANAAANAANNAAANVANAMNVTGGAMQSDVTYETPNSCGNGGCQNVLNGSAPYKSYDNCMSYCGRCNAYSTEPILREMIFYNNIYDKEHSYECDPVVQEEFQRIYAAW